MWDHTTATSGVETIISQSVGSHPYFDTTGTRLYLVNQDQWNTSYNSRTVYQYTLSTAWTPSTMSLTRTVTFPTNITMPANWALNSFHINSTGTHGYLVYSGVNYTPPGSVSGSGPAYIEHFTLSTPYDLSTYTYRDSFTSTFLATDIQTVRVSNDGKHLYVMGSIGYGYGIQRFELKTPFYTTGLDPWKPSNSITFGYSPWIRGWAFPKDETINYMFAALYDTKNIIRYTSLTQVVTGNY